MTYKMRRIRTLAINLGIIALAIASVLVALEVGLAFLKINTKSNGLYIDKEKNIRTLPGALLSPHQRGIFRRIYQFAWVSGPRTVLPEACEYL